MKSPLSARQKQALFTCSASILILEFFFIRLVPAYVINFNYFTNFVLLACFLGIGLGLIQASIQAPKIDFSFVCLASIGALTLTRIGASVEAKDMLLLQRGYGYLKLPYWLVVGGVFSILVFLFRQLAWHLGTLFNGADDSLAAYSWDLAGSLVGILIFSALSFRRTGPVWWFAAFCFFYLATLRLKAYRIRALHLFALVLSAVLLYGVSKDARWSPYYKITVGADRRVFVNDVAHQRMDDNPSAIFLYSHPYEVLRRKAYDNVLVIGAGAGNDVAAALAQPVRSIDAVEIDPEILKIGRESHPAAPYSDPRVKLHVDDGRSFLHKTDQRYDMIIFALTDSITQVSQQSALRLESYLFTREAFQEAKEHLKPDGVFVLSNYYWRPWLVEKIRSMLADVFGREPYVNFERKDARAVFLSSLDPRDFSDEEPATEFQWSKPSLVHSTDDWPFIYLQRRGIPWNYLVPCLMVIVLSSLLVLRPGGGLLIGRLSVVLFLTGAAFMLLETACLSRFMLLFGATWRVNAAVIAAILSMAWLANAWVRCFGARHLNIYVAAQALLLATSFFTPTRVFLDLTPVTRYAVASFIMLGPVFVAGLVFSAAFSRTEQPSLALGWNLFGAMVGGVLEYTALLTGYAFLFLLVAAFYVGAFILYRRTYRGS